MAMASTTSVEIQKYSYDIISNHFSKSEKATIIVARNPFARGGMRHAYKGWNTKAGTMIVVKRNIEGHTDFDSAKRNVRTQERCIALAEEFNKNPILAKKVEFTYSFAIRFLSGEWKGQYGTIEKYLEGNYVKHNCNIYMYGQDFALTERNTPQAFSRFTLQHTNYEELVCDIQGVNDEYTDPQVHTIKPSPQYSEGNLGWKGIWIFQAYHRCNEICRALNLTIRQMRTPAPVPVTQPCA